MKIHHISIRIAISFFLATCCPNYSLSQTSIEVSGSIDENTTWSHDTVKVIGDIYIGSITLVINPGTYVEFQGHYKMNVWGTLKAIGTADSLIVFTCHPDSIGSGWGGMTFSGNQQDTSVVNYCKFEYAKNTLPGFAGAILTNTPKLVILNSVFTDNHGDAAGAIYSWEHANTLIQGNYFSNNIGQASGINCSNSDAVIKDNTFIGEDEAVKCWISDPLIQNNFFGGGTSWAVKCNNSHARIIGNIICNNYGGIECTNSSNPLIVNNTICNNGRGINSQGSSNPILYNTIIYGNNDYQVQLQDLRSQPNFYFCDIEGAQAGFSASFPHNGIYENNMNTDPVFVAPSSGYGSSNFDPNADWSLEYESPLLNAGTLDLSVISLPEQDIEESPRISYGRIDIGGVEYHKNYINVCGIFSNDTVFYADTIKVTCDVIIDDNTTAEFLPGSVVEFQGYYGIKVVGTIIAAGSEENNILFTIRDTTGFSDFTSTAGSWRKILFNNNDPADAEPGAMSDNDSSRLSYCTFKYGKNIENDPVWKRGLISITSFSRIIIDRCTFMNNFGGVMNIGSSDISLTNNHFINNLAFETGAITVAGCNYLRIDNNVFIANKGGLEGDPFSGGAMFIRYSVGIIVTNNIFFNNFGARGGGFRLYNCDNSLFMNNLICNNEAVVGGGVAHWASYGCRYINNTIMNNKASESVGGVWVSIAPIEIYNNLIWGNEPQQINLNSAKSPSKVLNSNIQGGIIGFTGYTAGNIDLDPIITDPATGAGLDYIAAIADWMPMSVSPCINGGTMNIPDISFPMYDVDNNLRIHSGQIDIGAYENQGGIPQIVSQPFGGTRCEGELFSVFVSTIEPAHYQWQKDGIDIPGSDQPEFTIDIATKNDQGNYWCLVTNSYGTVTSNTATLFVNEIPEFLLEPPSMWIENGESVTLRTYAKGTNPVFQWQKNEADLAGEVTPELIISQVDYPDEGEYRCIISNVCGADTTPSAVLFLTPRICMVTFSTATGDNLVVWEKESGAPLTAYNIYRESQAAGIYDLLGTVGSSDLSVFVDTTADPTVQAYLYKITGVDVSGFETDLDLCAPHKTIHLLVSTNPELNTTQLEWDKYYGFDYGTYIIYRSPTGVGYDPIHYMASSLHSWTDPSPLPDIGYYRIGVEKTDACVPTGGGKKADSGPYSHALSNTEDNRLQDQGNQAPDTIILSNNSIDENLPVGSFVGRLETTDPDSSDYHVYKLVAGDGDIDNHRFTTLGDLLITAEELDYETINTCYIRVKTTDKGDLSYEKTFIIVVNDEDETIPNEAPTDLTLSSNTMAENMPAGSMVGRLWTEDPDIVDNHTYSLVAGDGSDDNGSFMVLGDMLLSDASFDYETQDTYRVRIQTSDQGDLTVEEAFTIVVTDVNEASGSNTAPTAITLSANTIEENRPSGMLVGAFSTTDPDAGDDHAYVLVDGFGADDNEDFMIMGNILISGAEFDYEAKDTLLIRVKSTDEGDLSTEESFIVLVSDLFEAEPNLSPTDIVLTSDVVDENMPAMTMIGRLQTDDPNMDDLHTYLLLEEDDFSSFVILGNVLFSTVIFDYEAQDEYSIRVRSADDGEGELSTEKSFTIMVNDLLEVGVDDLQGGAAGLSIYPNPFSHSTMIEFPNPDKEKYTLYITDLAGKVVRYEDNIFADKYELNRGNLPAGVYFIELRGDKIFRGKLVIE